MEASLVAAGAAVTTSELEAELADYEALYRRDRRAVVGLLYALTGSRGTAEELTQEAFLAAYRQWDTVGGYDDPGAWVRRVAVNQAASRGRRRAAEARALVRLGPRTTTTFDAMPVEDEAFWAAVRDLPGRQAQAVALHYLEDRSVDDIAAILDCAAATVKVHLHRGRQNLAETLGCTVEEEA